jgi:hypothetical protein
MARKKEAAIDFGADADAIASARKASAKKRMSTSGDDTEAVSSFLSNFAGGANGTIDPYAKKK